jgi:hypothetical protein
MRLRVTWRDVADGLNLTELSNEGYEHHTFNPVKGELPRTVFVTDALRSLGMQVRKVESVEVIEA